MATSSANIHGVQEFVELFSDVIVHLVCYLMFSPVIRFIVTTVNYSLSRAVGKNEVNWGTFAQSIHE